MRYETGNFIYEMEEFQILPDHSVYVWGAAEIVYTTEPPDYEVGYRGGISYYVDNIVIYADKKGKTNLEPDPKSELYRMTEQALMSPLHSFRITEQIERMV